MEESKLIAKRVPPGDRWSFIGEETIRSSLTETLEAYVIKSNYRGDYRLSPSKGELYIIVDKKDPKPEVKKFNLYGDY